VCRRRGRQAQDIVSLDSFQHGLDAEKAKRLTGLRARLSHRTGRNGFGTARDERDAQACPGAWNCQGWNVPPSMFLIQPPATGDASPGKA
jgi:hypothetical protein